MKKKSFFERLTGSVNIDEYDFEDEEEAPSVQTSKNTNRVENKPASWLDEENHEGQLTVDVYQTPTHIIIKSLVAGAEITIMELYWIHRRMVTVLKERYGISRRISCHLLNL